MVRTPPPVIVGVTSGQPDAVVLAASEFAAQFGAELICAAVDPSRFVLEELPDGSVTSASFDPDSLEAPTTEFDPGLAAQIERVLLSTRDLIPQGPKPYAETQVGRIATS